jgi:hypothetical protein
MVDPKIIIEGIPLEKLLEVYYKDLERKERNREANRRYKKTEKGRLTNNKLVKQHRMRKKAAAAAVVAVN